MKLRLTLLLCLTLFASTAHATTKVRIMYTAVSGYAASYIAKDQGFFEKRGLDVDLILAAHGGAIIGGVVSGSVEVGTPTPTVFLQAVDSGLDLVALAATNAFPERSNSGVLVRPASNIQKPLDLAGKKVGVPGINGLLDVIFRKWLADRGVDPKRLSYVEVSFPQMGDMMRAGNIEAAVAVDPFYSKIIDQKVGELLDNYTKWMPDGTIASVYCATGKWAAANPSAVKAFQEAIAEAVAFSKSNEVATRESIARYTKLPPPVVASVPTPNLSAKITPENLKFWIDIMKEREMLSGTPDAAKAVAPWLAAN